MVKPCIGVVGRLTGHKFEARYNHGEPKLQPKFVPHSTLQVDNTIKTMNATKKQTYVYDVCVRCGLVLNEHE